MAFTSAFIAAATDPWGEALQTRLYVRLNDGGGGSPGTLVELTTEQSVISMGPITRRREMAFGVVRGQSCQVQITNINLSVLDYNLMGCRVAVRGGFTAADEWDLFAQGKVASFSGSTNGTAILEVHDSVMDLINFTLPRDISFQETGWISGIGIVSKASGSGSYSSAQALTLNTASAADDETFTVEFYNVGSYKIILENGDETQIGTTGADKTIYNTANDIDIIVIPAAGWTGTFVSGDKFEFFTARPRTLGSGGELTPVYMLMHLIDDISGVSAYDVLDGSEYSDPSNTS